MTSQPSTLFHRFLRDPLLHFGLIGAGIFAVFYALNDTPAAPRENQLIISVDDVTRLTSQFRGTWMRAPTLAERDGLIDALVHEEVLVREAITLGLDQNDAVIRQRLRQKMDFLIESSAQTIVPDDAVLQAFLADRAQDYAIDPKLAFTQIYLGDHATPEQVAATLAALENGTEDAELGQRTMLPRALPLTPQWGVDRSFGAGFFALIDADVPGVWQGPVASSFGAHLVRVEGYEVGRAPDFDDVRDQVERDWRVQETKRLKDKTYELFRARYDIRTPDASALEATVDVATPVSQ